MENLELDGTTSVWITRSEAARALGVSTTMVRKFERSGTLRAIRQKGRVFCDAAAVEALRLERQARKLEREAATGACESEEEQDEFNRWQVEQAAWERQLEKQRQRHAREQEQLEFDRLRRRCDRLEQRCRLLSLLRDSKPLHTSPPSSLLGDVMVVAAPLLLTAGALYLASQVKTGPADGSPAHTTSSDPGHSESGDGSPGGSSGAPVGPT